MKEKLYIEKGRDGTIWQHNFARQNVLAHHHDELEINLVTRGGATYLLGDRKYELRRHSLVWLFPEQEHILLDQSRDYAMWILIFRPSLIKRVMMGESNIMLCEANPPGNFCRRISEQNSARLEELFSEIVNATDLDLYNAGLAYALTLAWAVHGVSANLSPFSGVHPCVEKAARALRDESETLRLPQLARGVGMSESRLSRLFKAQTGVTISEFRNRQRIEKFLQLYGTGNEKSLNEAALEAGFGSYPQFHRVFKNMMGYAPHSHRKIVDDQ